MTDTKKWVRRGDYIVSPEHAAEIDAHATLLEQDRLEEIRQLREEIAEMDSLGPLIDESLVDFWADPDADGLQSVSSQMVYDYAVNQCRTQRILSRLQCELEQLQQGLKTEVLK